MKRKVGRGDGVTAFLEQYHEQSPERSLVAERAVVVARIRDLAAGNAVDEGSGDVLDRLIDTRMTETGEHLRRDYLARRALIQELLDVAAAREGELQEHVESLETRRDQMAATADRSHTWLLGAEPARNGVPAPTHRRNQ